MEVLATLIRYIVTTFILFIIIIPSLKYYKREKNSIGKLLFFGSLLIFIYYTIDSFSLLIIRFEFDSFLYGLIFGSLRIIFFIGFVCFAIGFYKLMKSINSKTKNELDEIGKD